MFKSDSNYEAENKYRRNDFVNSIYLKNVTRLDLLTSAPFCSKNSLYSQEQFEFYNKSIVKVHDPLYVQMFGLGITASNENCV